MKQKALREDAHSREAETCLTLTGKKPYDMMIALKGSSYNHVTNRP